VSPILGIYASQISGHLFAPSGAYDSIATVTVGSGGASTVTFTSIPSTYTHLQVRYIARTSSAAPGSEGDLVLVYGTPHAGNGYSHILFGNGSSTGASNSGGLAFSQYSSYATSSTQTASTFGTGILDVLDYSNPNKLKTWRTLGGWDANGSGFVNLTSGIQNDTSVLTGIGFAVNSGNSFAQHSQFALYGIRGN
jgi:hypothetical protein